MSEKCLTITGCVRRLLILGWLASVPPLAAQGATAAVAASETDAPALSQSSPANEANTVALDATISLQFTQSMQASTLTPASVTLLGPQGPTPIEVRTGEGHQQAVIVPRQDLLPDSRYTLFVSEARSAGGRMLPLTTVAFTTATLNAETRLAHADTTTSLPAAGDTLRLSAGVAKAEAELRTSCESTSAVNGYRFCHDRGSVQGGVFTPGASNIGGHWRTNVPLPRVLKAADLPASKRKSGVTTVFGTVRRIDDEPLAHVSISVGSLTTRTDGAGRFVLENVPSGHQVLLVDGRSADHGDEEYGQFPVAIDVNKGKANGIPYTMFMPRITARDKVEIPSPTTTETVITHPGIPGLELHLPAGTVIRDREGKVLTEFALVPMPVDRSPVPAPANFQQYFSLQPGGASVQGLSAASATGIRTVYPSYTEHTEPHQWFYYYDAEHAGWTMYGEGQVSQDGKTIDTAGSWGSLTFMPAGGGFVGGTTVPVGRPPCMDADPVACATGAFIHSVSDLTINDLEPVEFTRTYVSNDSASRSFGRGMTNPFEAYLYAPVTGCTYLKSFTGSEIDLVDADGSIYPFFVPAGKTFWTSPGTHTATPSKFYGALLTVDDASTTIQLVDGTIYRFNQACPAALNSITDRFGNTTTILFNAGLINEVTLPSGRSVSYAYNSNNEISRLTDSAGRSVAYTYGANNLLSTVTYPDSTTEQYTYDSNGNMLTVVDRRGHTMATNQYDANQRVGTQTYEDGTYYQFAYTMSGRFASTTDVTNARGAVKHIVFDAQGYPTSITRAYGTPIAQTTSYARGPGELPIAVTDPLGRVTTMTYDAFGDTLTKTYLSGTAAAVTYTYTYTSDFHKVASITDPLNHTTNYGYTAGCLTSVQDALGHAVNLTCASAGQPLTVQDPLGHTTALTYAGTDLTAVVDPLNRTTTITPDELGRSIAMQDPLGRQSRATYDTSGRITQSVDPLNQATGYAYDGNGNLLSVTDPNGGKTQYGYDARNRRTSRTDALNQSESWTYDGMGNRQTNTDRKSQLTTYQYDALDRPSLITYADGSTVTPTFDAGNRLTQVVDSVSGTITRNYDGLDRLTQEQTPQGTVAYTYDAAGRRASMTPGSQAPITYTYDAADRLTQIAQGSETVNLTYDAANRRNTLTLPNGVVTTYAYDNANELTSLSYATGSGTPLGSVAYTYDVAGQRVSQAGGFAPDLLPTPTTATNTFDLNNRQTGWNGFSLGYDLNGDPMSNGGTSPATAYAFDARHRLTQITQGGTTIGSFTYDAFGRRTSKTVNGTTTNFLYDGENAVQETQGTNVYSILTGLGIDERFARSEAAGRYDFLTDALGSTLALTDGTGAVQQTYAYEPYGEVSSTGPSNNPYQYTGRENDGTGLYYYRARYYSPTLKRFISEDPMGLAAGLNEYAYVGGDPANLIDPLGRQWMPTCAFQPGGCGNRYAYFPPVPDPQPKCTCGDPDEGKKLGIAGGAGLGGAAAAVALVALTPQTAGGSDACLLLLLTGEAAEPSLTAITGAMMFGAQYGGTGGLGVGLVYDYYRNKTCGCQ